MSKEKLAPLPSIPLGLYRHYKGQLYEVIGMARHSETLQPWWCTGRFTASMACGSGLPKCLKSGLKSRAFHSHALPGWYLIHRCANSWAIARG